MNKRSLYYNKTELRERGWTDSMIAEFLKDSRCVEFQGTLKSKPQKCYLKSKVEKIEKSKKFKSNFLMSKERRKCVQKRVERIKAFNLESLEKSADKIKVIKKPIEDIWKGAFMTKMNWYMANGEVEFSLARPCDIDEATKKRWCVNYIRHKKTKYDFKLRSLFGKVGASEMYLALHKIVLLKIKETYPELKDECERQIGKMKDDK